MVTKIQTEQVAKTHHRFNRFGAYLRFSIMRNSENSPEGDMKSFYDHFEIDMMTYTDGTCCGSLTAYEVTPEDLRKIGEKLIKMADEYEKTVQDAIDKINE